MLGNLEKYVMKLTYSVYHRIIHSKSVYNVNAESITKQKKRFMKCLGNNSYLSELFLAGNCNFIAKHTARSPSHVARGAWRTLLVYTAKNHTLFGSFEIITNQIKEIFGKELKLKNFFPLNSFGPGYKIH